MDKFKSFSIEKFSGENFQLWKYQMEIIFRAEGLTELINGKVIRPDNASEAKLRKEWEELNAKAMLIISTSMQYEQLQTVMACETAADMWKRLKIIHEQRSAINKVILKQKFLIIRWQRLTP